MYTYFLKLKLTFDKFLLVPVLEISRINVPQSTQLIKWHQMFIEFATIVEYFTRFKCGRSFCHIEIR